MKEILIGKSTSELTGYLTNTLGEQSYRGKQLSSWLYQKTVREFDKMTDLGKELRQKLSDLSEISVNRIVTKNLSSDGTAKYLISLGNRNTIECVNILQSTHNTACLSTQVGCSIKCPFCATGLSGFKYNLKAGDIVDQYLLMQQDSEQRIKKVVFMGMGEPLLNYSETLKAVHLLNQEIGVGIRNITISTSGIIKNIKKLMKEKLQINLAVSLHSADNEKRNYLVPVNKSNPLDKLLDICREYARITKRRITFEYVMLNEKNDSYSDAINLTRKLRGIHCHINLIPYNCVDNFEEFRASPMKRIKDFQKILLDRKFPTTIRISRGSNVNSACGQLRVTHSE